MQISPFQGYALHKNPVAISNVWTNIASRRGAEKRIDIICPHPIEMHWSGMWLNDVRVDKTPGPPHRMKTTHVLSCTCTWVNHYKLYDKHMLYVIDWYHDVSWNMNVCKGSRMYTHIYMTLYWIHSYGTCNDLCNDCNECVCVLHCVSFSLPAPGR